MDKDYILSVIEQNFTNESKTILLNQFETFREISKIDFTQKKYKIGDEVLLDKGTLLHGTFNNLDGLKYIAQKGLIASDFTKSRKSKYPSCVCVWKLKEKYKLKDYINFYSGGTIKYSGLLINNEYSQEIQTQIIQYDELNQLNNILKKHPCRFWNIEQTKESRFMPSLSQDKVQIGIIFKNNEYTELFINHGDILNEEIVDDVLAKDFVNPDYYDKFIIDRKNKDDFFTDRESAILFGLPVNLIDGILVGREYENKKEKLDEIKELLPNVYICNLDGIVIVEN